METVRANSLCPFCPICNGVTRSPMMLACCGYMACGRCLLTESCPSLDRHCPACRSTRPRCRVRIDRSWEPAEDQPISSTQAASCDISTFAATQENVNASPGRDAKQRSDITFEGSRKKEDVSSKTITKPRENTMKRKLSGDMPAPCRKRVRRPSVIFIGDSQLQLLTRDQEFSLLAWEERWSLRMRRGGCIHHIANLARPYTDWLARTSNGTSSCSSSSSSHVLVVCVGGNDVSNACKRGVDFRMVEESAEELGYILKRAAHYGAQVLWIQVSPRKDIHDEARVYFNRVVGEHIAGCKQIKSVDLVGNYEPRQFVKNKLWRDEIHFGRGLFTAMLDSVMEEIELQRIPKSSHAQHFVPSEGRMCQTCGRRGHTRDRCFTYA